MREQITDEFRAFMEDDQGIVFAADGRFFPQSAALKRV
jgi:hypothetical protein